MITIIEERPEHRAAIAELNHAAFGGGFEAELVERLNRDGLVAASLVALAGGTGEGAAEGAAEGDEPVGHILFSELAVEVDGSAVRAVALAPVAVRPDRQRRGIGSPLVTAGLSFVRDRGWGAVIVLGHPAYYPRFGFSAALAGKLNSPFAGQAFMALELVPGALAGHMGSVRYPPAFEP